MLCDLHRNGFQDLVFQVLKALMYDILMQTVEGTVHFLDMHVLHVVPIEINIRWLILSLNQELAVCPSLDVL